MVKNHFAKAFFIALLVVLGANIYCLAYHCNERASKNLMRVFYCMVCLNQGIAAQSTLGRVLKRRRSKRIWRIAKKKINQQMNETGNRNR